MNNLEFKLIDPSGQNVWWMNRRELRVPPRLAEMRTKKRQIEFAWGPLGGGEMKQVAALEIAVTAGTRRQGDGLDRRPEAHRAAAGPPYARTPAVTHSADAVTYDFLEPREYGGLVIDWEPGS